MKNGLKKLALCGLMLGALYAGAVCAEEQKAPTKSKNAMIAERVDAAATEQHALNKDVLLERRLKKSPVFSNPRYAKKVYGQLQGIEQAAEKEREEMAQLQEFQSEAEKEAYKKKLEEDAMLGFKPFEGDPAKVNAQIVADPAHQTHEMIKRMKKPRSEQLTDARQKDFQKRGEGLFKEENGMTPDEYLALEREQMLSHIEQDIPADVLGQDVRFKKPSDMEVEKTSETTARLKPAKAKKAK